MPYYTPKKYIIEDIKEFTKDVRLLKINCNLNPKPGQFLEVSIPGIGECPLASCSNNPNYIDMLTRNAGNVTSTIFQLKKGDTIHIRGPYGKGFPIKRLKNKNLILVAGGTGIAPVTSLIDFIVKNRALFKDIHIYFGFRNEKYILLQDKINNWKKMFNLTLCLDKKDNPNCNITCETGFIHNIMDKIKPELNNTIAIMCGPEIMMQSVTDKLINLGLKENKILWSMERRMECGFGNCNRCLIQDVYVCKDGPVFRYDIIKPKIENEESSNEKK
ncbi:anaerobic sulfite reductase subunit AsrB [Candidatus Pacearchaeota archaeon]|nr:anaerobic sulfite reductase subunit AsrB [Candidatus Pacearchaeota archaeon]